MSKVQAMLAWQDVPPPAPDGKPQDDTPPQDEPDPRQPSPNRQRRGPLFRWTRQRGVARTAVWRPWWLLGLVEVVTHPLPRYLDQLVRRIELPALPAFEDLPARPARVLLVAV